MLRIKHIRIKNFRSIVDLSIDTDMMNIFVGLNDAGKSNILKALNLFFNGETEPGCPFDFETDYSKYAPIRKKKAKEIMISIVFSIPERYSYHEDVEWVKTWRISGLHKDSKNQWNFTPYSKVPTLLNRIRYKYVPAIKSDNYFKFLLADLYMSIAKEANSELIDKAEEYSYALDGFTQEIGLRVQKTVGIKSNLIMPSNQVDIFKELIFVTNDKSGKSIDLSYRGDGIKAVHIPAILKYIAEQDNRIMTNTAVPITSIWGYEEPENGIEMKKCFDLAKELSEFSDEVQEFITTHSPAFYQLGNETCTKVYYVYKETQNYSSEVQQEMNYFDLHDKIGIMPLIAPMVQEKQEELLALKKILNTAKFADRDTIFVEGITDKSYLEMGIKAFSPKLQKMIDDGSLQIVTREENGCGTGLLVDWAIAWMHLNYTKKAIFLLDADQAGKNARDKIKEAKEKFRKKKFKLKPLFLQPTDDMKVVNDKINNSLTITIEHLLSYDFWLQLQKYGLVEERSDKEVLEIFKNVLEISKSLEKTIDDILDNKKMRDTIIYLKPKDDKKNKIFKLANNEVKNGNVSVIEGLKNTIAQFEKEF